MLIGGRITSEVSSVDASTDASTGGAVVDIWREPQVGWVKVPTFLLLSGAVKAAADAAKRAVTIVALANFMVTLYSLQVVRGEY